MARVVKIERDGPYKIEPSEFPKDKPIWICGCGLSAKMPYCDGTHKPCKTEEPGKTYSYGPDGRTQVP